MQTIDEYIRIAKERKAASKWGRAINGYMIDLLERLEERYNWDHESNGYEDDSAQWLSENCGTPDKLEKKCLCGAPDWHEYSWGGCSIIYNDQLAEYLLTPSEQKRLGWKRDDKGDLYGGRSEWSSKGKFFHLLDMQELGLMKACNRLKILICEKMH